MFTKRRLINKSKNKLKHFAIFNFSQTVVLNTLTSEFVVIDNPLSNEDTVCGVHLMNQYVFIYGKLSWCKFDLRGNLLDTHTNPEDSNKWPILCKICRS